MKTLARALWCAMVVLVPTSSWAQISAVVAIEPTARKAGLMLSRYATESKLGKLLGQPVKVASGGGAKSAAKDEVPRG